MQHFILLSILLCSQLHLAFTKIDVGEQIVDAKVDLKKMKSSSKIVGGAKKKAETTKKFSEDNIPVIELKGEGKPMTSAQIRALEEEAEGRPLDIKVKKTWVPKKCQHEARRMDFVTFHYKGFLEDNKKFGQTWENN